MNHLVPIKKIWNRPIILQIMRMTLMMAMKSWWQRWWWLRGLVLCLWQWPPWHVTCEDNGHLVMYRMLIIGHLNCTILGLQIVGLSPHKVSFKPKTKKISLSQVIKSIFKHSFDFSFFSFSFYCAAKSIVVDQKKIKFSTAKSQKNNIYDLLGFLTPLGKLNIDVSSRGNFGPLEAGAIFGNHSTIIMVVG